MSDLVETDELYDYLSAHQISFFLPPDHWRSAPSARFDWRAVQLAQPKKSMVPKTPGVYTLLIQPGIFLHPSCSYLAYAGQSINLWRRFGEYLTKERRIRPRIHRLLKKWEGFIYFCFAETDQAELDRLEEMLHRHYVPPFVSRFRGTLKQAVGAFTP